MWWFYIFLLAMALVGGFGLGAWYVLDTVRQKQLANARSKRVASSPQPVAVPRRVKARRRPTEEWLAGADLLRYPARLSELETELQRSHRAAQEQLQHLSVKQAEVAAKGREELAARYQQDREVLDRRAGATRRVMATVWKTRAILLLRVHLAIAARRRPQIDHLPKPLDVKPTELEHAASNYALACRSVQEFVQHLDAERAMIDALVPDASLSAEVTDEHKAAVAAEREGVEATFMRLRERMDSLADTLEYLSDRFRTQRVVEGAPLNLDVGPEAGRLLDEVGQALAELEGLSAVGDKGLADAAVDNIAEDISQLERAGMEAEAEAEASLEVERLLKQFA